MENSDSSTESSWKKYVAGAFVEKKWSTTKTAMGSIISQRT
jgi:hypothetical protein